MVSVLHHVTQALRAHKLFARDVDYIVKDDQVVIIDEFTGRMMAGRRYSEGLHQALEAKEQVEIQRENQTLASITFQNLFRMYPKLSGMTGTAMTEAAEFGEIYRLEVVEIPTNVPVVAQGRRRRDLPHARREDARHRQADRGVPRPQPADAGRHGVDREVRGAVGGAEEAGHPAQRAERPLPRAGSRDHGPGRPAGLGHHRHQHGRPRHRHPARRQRRDAGAARASPRSTRSSPTRPTRKAEIERVAAEIRAGVERDREIVLKAGGLYVVGTERHESRRIDNQLRGRSGRQGDPGASKFFLSLEDDLMRIFGNNKVLDWVQKKGMADDEALTHRWLNKALETAQGKVEARNFEIRKNLLRFDDVMNSQRKEIYKERIELMGTEDVSETVAGMRRDVVDALVAPHHPRGRLRRAVEGGGAQGRGAAPVRPRPAGRPVGQGRGHRRRGDPDRG